MQFQLIVTYSIAAGAHTTFFLATPNNKLSDVERYPEVEPTEECQVCKSGEDEEGRTLLECEKVRSLQSHQTLCEYS